MNVDATLKQVILVNDFVPYEAGPIEDIRWRLVKSSKYGDIWGILIDAKKIAWLKFNTLSTHSASTLYQ